MNNNRLNSLNKNGLLVEIDNLSVIGLCMAIFIGPVKNESPKRVHGQVRFRLHYRPVFQL